MPSKAQEQLQKLDYALWDLTREELRKVQAPVDDYLSMQDIVKSHHKTLAAIVHESMKQLEKAYPLVSSEDKKALENLMIDSLAGVEESVLAREEDYKVTYSNYFFNAKSLEESADTASTGFKIHLSADEQSRQNLARAWSATVHVARMHGISSFKMASEPTVDDKKGRQVTVYFHLPAERVPEFAQKVPTIVRDFACRLSYEHVKPDPRGMPDDCLVIPGSRYISFRGDAIEFASGPSYLSQDHLDCAKHIFETLGPTENPASSQSLEMIHQYINEINERYGATLDPEDFIPEVQTVLQKAQSQMEEKGKVMWHNLDPRPEDVPLGDALQSCNVSKTAVMQAEVQGLRHRSQKGDITIVDEPIRREALLDEEARERAELISKAMR